MVRRQVERLRKVEGAAACEAAWVRPQAAG
jgi:hypothetical protein